MLIQCKACNVSFDDSMSKCIVCGAPALFSKEENLRKGEQLATEWIRLGEKTKVIREKLLIHSPLPEAEVDVILKRLQSSREAARYMRLENIGCLVLIILFGFLFNSLMRAIFPFQLLLPGP